MTLTTYDSHNLDTCMGTVRDSPRGCLQFASVKEEPNSNREFPPAQATPEAQRSSPHGTSPWPDCREQGCLLACLQHTWSTGRRPQECRSQEGHRLTHSGSESCMVVSFLRIALGLADEASLQGYITMLLPRVSSRGSSLFGLAVEACSEFTVNTDKCLHSKNIIGAGWKKPISPGPDQRWGNERTQVLTQSALLDSFVCFSQNFLPTKDIKRGEVSNLSDQRYVHIWRHNLNNFDRWIISIPAFHHSYKSQLFFKKIYVCY